MAEKVWVQKLNGLCLVDRQENFMSELENIVYELRHSDIFGFSLIPVSDAFEFPYKIYGLEESLIKRILKYYNKTESGNLGILLNGVKGTGKTVTSKIIANKLHQPVILVTSEIEGAEHYINSIPQDITVFIDEYEKIYKDSKNFLTVMDGALNSVHRRVFILTTNNLYVDTNLIDRPSRVRYLKTFDNLAPEIVEEIVNDVLLIPELKDECIKYISTLEIITVDIVKTVVNEVNIQEESPMKFKSVFNASVKKGKYKVFIENNNELEPFMKNAKISPRTNYGENSLTSGFYVNDIFIGRIKEVIDFNTVIVNVRETEVEIEDEGDEITDAINNIAKNLLLPTDKKRGRKKAQESKPKYKKVTAFDLPAGDVTFVVQEDYVYNENYQYGKRVFSEYDEYPY